LLVLLCNFFCTLIPLYLCFLFVLYMGLKLLFYESSHIEFGWTGG
jgi:hypothetical protein